MIFLPGDLVAFFFKSTDNFDNLWTILMVGGLFLIATGIKKRSQKTKTIKKTSTKKDPIYVDIDENGRYVYNESAKMWVDKSQCDPQENKRKYEENRKRWTDHERQLAEKEQERLRVEKIFEESRKYPNLTEEEIELAKQIRINRNGPTYEEWKAEKLKKELESTPKNTTTEQGTYRYDYIHTPSEQQQHFHHEDTAIKVTQEVRHEPKQEPEREVPKSQYAEAYEVTPLLTTNESRNYKILQEAADVKGYRICPKVRLADIVKPKNDEKYMSHFGKIKAKHVDFAVCDRNMKVLAVVELDDSSHDRKDRQERDEFVDTILTSNGIKVIHTRHITHDILDNI